MNDERITRRCRPYPEQPPPPPMAVDMVEDADHAARAMWEWAFAIVIAAVLLAIGFILGRVTV